MASKIKRGHGRRRGGDRRDGGPAGVAADGGGARGRRRGLELAGLEVLRWAHGGDGVAVPEAGPLAGAVVFVPGAVPGDRVRVEVIEGKARWARARLIAVEEASAERVTPPCPVQESCGGCPWMAGSEEAQRASRLAILGGEARKRLGWDAARVAADVSLVDVPGAARFGYRPRVKLAWRATGEGPAALGFLRKTSHELVPISACAVADGAINAALPELAAEIGRRARGRGSLTVVAGREGVGAWVEVEGAAGFGLGRSEVTVDVGERAHRVGPRTFLQANPRVAAAMVAAIEGYAREVAGRHAVELFAGSGALTPALWAAGYDVDAYELDAAGEGGFAALRDGLGLAPERGRWSAADLLGIGVPLPPPRATPDLVLLDPPRAGAASVIPWIRASGARAVILMSCDVATGFRDLAALEQGATSGGDRWRVEAVSGWDMFPHTGHQELLAFARPVEALG